MGKKKLVGVLGIPFGGKGTLSKKMENLYDCLHISTGDLLRKENDPVLNEQMNLGLIVSSKTPILLVKKEINKTQKPLLILDGIPRDYKQYVVFSEEIGEFDLLFWLICSEKEIEKRNDKRNKTDDKRFDKTKECTTKRIELYWKETLSIFNLFNTKKIIINTTNKTIQECLDIIDKSMKKYIFS